MDIDEATHGIDLTESIEARLFPTQPQYSGQYPVAAGVARAHFSGKDFSGRPPALEYRVHWATIADLGADHVFSARGTLTIHLLARTVSGSRYIRLHEQMVIRTKQPELLFVETDFDAHRITASNAA